MSYSVFDLLGDADDFIKHRNISLHLQTMEWIDSIAQ